MCRQQLQSNLWEGHSPSSGLRCLCTARCPSTCRTTLLRESLKLCFGKINLPVVFPRARNRTSYGGSSPPRCWALSLGSESLSSSTRLQGRSMGIALIIRSFVALTTNHSLILLSLQLASSHCKIRCSWMFHSPLLIKKGI